MRDDFGNVIGVSRTGAGEPETRTREYEFGEDGRSVLPTALIENQHRVELEFDPARGDLIATRDEARPGSSPLTSYWLRDGFGRSLVSIQPNGRSTTVRYIQDAPLRIEVAEQLGASTRTEYDSLGREVRQVERDPLGKQLERITSYDVLGRHRGVTRPQDVADTSPRQQTTFTYDRLGRLLRSELPNGDATELCYAAGSGGGDGALSCTRDARGFVNCAAFDLRMRV